MLPRGLRCLGSGRVGVGSVSRSVVETASRASAAAATSTAAAGESASEAGVGLDGGLFVVLDEVVERHVQSARHL